jgi:hypothetical protein
MRFEVPPAIVRLSFVLGVIAAGAAVYALVQGARPLAIGLGVAATVALGVSSRFKQHL